MALVEIYPNNMSGRRYSDDHFKRHSDYNSCCEWYEDGNEIVVILNTETNTEAVYERLGGLLCLDERFGIYCNVDVDDDWTGHNELIRKMLVQEATAVGFPVECPKPELHEYAVTLRRTIRISVMAQDPEQAQRIGEKLASGSGEFGCQVVNNTMSNGDDEFYGVGSADNGFCHEKLGAEDSMRVLNEEE